MHPRHGFPPHPSNSETFARGTVVTHHAHAAPGAPASSAGALAGWLLLCVGGGTLLGLVTPGGDSPWYATLDKPGWNPPNWVFAPVWTTLYALMAVAAWLVWRRGGWEHQRPALTVFLAQLVANFAWSPLFFTAQRPGLALADIILLWLLIVTTMWAFARIERRAAWLLAPYLVWVSYALSLNAAVVALN